jgi:hypothetical protein
MMCIGASIIDDLPRKSLVVVSQEDAKSDTIQESRCSPQYTFEGVLRSFEPSYKL